MCKLYMYDEKTGERHELADGTFYRRPEGTHPPCHYDKKACPKGTYEDRKAELSDRNRKTYLHYLRCKATNQFPNDDLVRHNAALIMHTEETLSVFKMQSMMGLMGSLFRG